MIKLNDKYFIDFDPCNIMLKERKIGKAGKSKGQEMFDVIGYYTSFDELANSMLKKCYLDEGDVSFKSLKDIQNLMIELKNEIVEQIKKVVNEKGEIKNESNKE